MDRHSTATARYEALGRPVRLRTTLPLATYTRMVGIAVGRDLTASQAIAEAVRDWTLRHEQHMNRMDRLRVEAALRRAMDAQPIEEVLRGLR